eukprot:781609-Rhodomonas_salina.2
MGGSPAASYPDHHQTSQRMQQSAQAVPWKGARRAPTYPGYSAPSRSSFRLTRSRHECRYFVFLDNGPFFTQIEMFHLGDLNNCDFGTNLVQDFGTRDANNAK